jgi:hypothetical protein
MIVVNVGHIFLRIIQGRDFLKFRKILLYSFLTNSKQTNNQNCHLTQY